MSPHPLLVVEHEAQCPPGHLGGWLVDAGLTLDVRRPYAGDVLPDDLTAHVGMLVLGGEMGAEQDASYPWLPQVRRLVGGAAQAGTPVLGVCLGLQLAAVALGGAVGVNPLGQQIGVLGVGWTDAAHEDPVFARVAARGRTADEVPAVHWNDDVVTRLPSGTVVLARAERGELQAARLTPTVWGVQWHPEVGAEIIGAWAEHDRDLAAERGIDLSGYVADVAAAEPRAREVWAGVAERVRGRLPDLGARAMSPARLVARATQLARLGFEDPEAAGRNAERLGTSAEPLLHLAGASADPDQALAYLADLADRVEDRDRLLRELVDDEGTSMRLLSVLGASSALGDHLLRHPEQWWDLTDPLLGSTRPSASGLRAELLSAVGADPDADAPVATGPDAACVDALRVTYRRLLLRLASRDLSHGLGVDDVAAELSDLAAGTLDAALSVARARVGEAAAGTRLAVVAMGKCGGHELNYVSDVDVIFVAEPAEPAEGHDEQASLRTATQLASHLMRICSDPTGEGTIWPVDAGLRPEGRSGPLVRTLASHEAYYQKWARTWEFQALLKARPVAGDLALGAQYVERIAPLVWSASERDGFVTEVQTMRRRVLAHIPAAQADRQIKLGAGGLRDVEFAVQLLQLVHGRSDPGVRSPATLSALANLTRAGYVGRDDGAALDDAYRFLRTLEHRMQLSHLTRTHLLPEDEGSLRRLARSMGLTRHPVAELDAAWRQHAREVRRLHEKLFYRPLLAAVARLPTDEARLSVASARQRLAALGYEDPVAALRHLEALTSGVSRTATIQRTLLPAMLGWFADGPNPDAGLFGFRTISESLGSTHWYLQTLRDEGQVAQRLATLLSTSRYATDLLQRAPEGVRMLASDEELRPMSRAALRKEMTSRPAASTTRWRPSPRCGRSGAASCSGSRSATCSTPLTWTRWATP